MMIAGNLRAVIEDTQKEFGFWIAVRKEMHRSFRRASIFPSMLLLVAE